MVAGPALAQTAPKPATTAAATTAAATAAQPPDTLPPELSAPPVPLPTGAPDETTLPALPDGDNVAWPTVESTADAEPPPADTEVRYEVAVEGLKPLGLQDEFESLSSLWTGRTAPANQAQLRRRIAEDRDLIDQLLRSVGHYGGDAKVAISELPDGRSRVAISVVPGPMYEFAGITVKGPAGAPADAIDPAPIVTPMLGVFPGDPVDAAQVTSAQEALPTRLADAGFAFAQVYAPEITIDHALRSGNLLQTVDLGRRGVFGALTLQGESAGFDQKHLWLLPRFKPGDAYNNAGRDDLRRALVQTGLFGSVGIKPIDGGTTPDGRQRVDLEITTEAAPPRTITASAGYSTGQGARLEAAWTHRNLFPPEGAFTVRSVAAQREQVAQVELRRRNFGKRDQILTLSGGISFSQQFAFSANTGGITASLARESNIIWQKPWTYAIGAQLLVTSQRDRSALTLNRNLFYVLAFPGTITWDQSDDLLNPSRGFRITGRLSPEFTLRDGRNLNYVKTQIDGTIYHPFGPVVLAGRLHLGTIVGAERGLIAPDRRFYAGGGGSVRGYGFQAVGPQADDGTPTGGNSLTEVAIEARYRTRAFGADVGFVAFVDGGQVYQSTVPSFNSLKLGAGVGIRYYSSFGPIRVDIATPLNKGPRDPRIAFYVSIGQAF